MTSTVFFLKEDEKVYHQQTNDKINIVTCGPFFVTDVI
jgi:hypothetical protein